MIPIPQNHTDSAVIYICAKGRKVNKTFLMVNLILITISQLVLGQQPNDNNEEAFLKQIESSEHFVAKSNDLSLSNTAQIQQIGDYNNASINQTLMGTNVSGNVAELIQNGDINIVVLNQTGGGNNHYIYQNGNSNMLETSVLGDNNSSLINQIGSSNLVNQKLSGNGMTFVLSQYGNNNEIVQVENNQSSQKYEIIQNGNGMQLVIINGGILP